MEKFIRIVCVLAGSLFFALTLFCVTLMLCPSFTIFGVRFIGFAQEQYSDREDILGSYSNSELIIKTNEIDTEIHFTNSNHSYVVYKQSFMGFTKTPYNEKYVKTTEENGALCLSFSDPKSIVYGVNRNNDKIDIYLPTNMNTLTVQSDKSNVTFLGSGFTANSVNIDTSGSTKFNNVISASQINVENAKVDINAKMPSVSTFNINTSRAVNINVDNHANYNIETSGNVKVANCSNLSIKTAIGKIKAIDDDCVITGNATIETTSGNVSLGSVYGAVNINTKYGDVDLGFGSNVDIYNAKGNSKIIECQNIDIESNSGNISILKASGIINANTKQGSIIAENINGEKCTLTSERGNIKITNCSATRLFLTAERSKIIAKEISCDTSQIVSSGKIEVSFINVGDNINVIAGNNDVKIEMSQKNYICDIKTESEKSILQIGSYVSNGTSFNDQTQGDGCLIKVRTKSGNVQII